MHEECTKEHDTKSKYGPKDTLLPADADHSSELEKGDDFDPFRISRSSGQIGEGSPAGLGLMQVADAFCRGVLARNEARFRKGLPPLCGEMVWAAGGTYVYACELPAEHEGSCQAHDIDGQVIERANPLRGGITAAQAREWGEAAARFANESISRAILGSSISHPNTDTDCPTCSEPVIASLGIRLDGGGS